MNNFTTFFDENSRIQNYLSRKFMVLAILITFSTNGFAASGLFDAYTIFSINGGANTYTKFSAVQDWSIGSFTYGSSSLILNGAQNKTYKNGGSNVTGGQIAYKVYLTSAGSGSASFSFIQLSFGENYPAPGDQRWETNNANINLLSGRDVGSYTIEVYFQAYTSDGDSYLSNSAANYKATFTITAAVATVTATASQSKVYGAADPTYTFSTSPSVTTSGALSRATGENVATSPYSYTIGTLASTNTNYTLSLAAGTFAITKATPTATLEITNSPAHYNGSGQSASVFATTSSVPGTVADVLTGGAAEQTALGTYAVTASFVPDDSSNYNTLTGLSAGNFVIDNTTVWGFSGWSNGTPIASQDAIISMAYVTTDPTGSFSCNNLTVNAGSSLTVSAGTSVTVAGTLVNNQAINVENNGNFIQTGVTDTNSGSGTVSVTRNSNALKRLDYTMWSSPVSGTQTLAAFSPLTSQSPNRFYAYNPNTNAFNGATVGDPFETGKGYLIRMPNEKPSDLDPAVGTGTGTAYYGGTETLAYQGVFTGTSLNNGTVTLSGLDSDKYYAVGNPYPSTISAAAFLTANPGTLYFWRKTNGAVGTAYATYNSVGPVAAGSGLTGNGSAVPNGTIQVGQGFIAKTGVAANQLVFTNAMRTNNTENQFFKTKNTADKSRLWLDLSDATGRMNQVLIGYLATATQGVDAGIDGKYFNDSPIALTSIVEGEEYVIQGRPTFDVTDVVALGFKTDVAGDYTIALNSFDGLFAEGQDIYLVDAIAGKEIDLKSESYSFTTATGVDNTRFSLKYQKTLKVEAPTFDDNSVKVYKNNGAIYVNSTSKTIKTIQVYDVQGRLIAQQKNVNAATATINNLKAINQMLIVKVSAEDNSEVSKKVMN